MLTYTWWQERKMTNLLADRISRHKLFIQRMSKRVATSNIFFLFFCRCLPLNEEKMNGWQSLLLWFSKWCRELFRRKRKKKREYKGTVFMPEKNWEKKARRRQEKSLCECAHLTASFTCAIHHFLYSFVLLFFFFCHHLFYDYYYC